ncbi:hypothetical protein QFC24_006330 [Naganishia onofrii]|uniref:Uncharacterized protein n=1 Tax=Naganishia onofrii TaxID=1851511 RepID=A0ACC2X202_9TREE|nr:hypothetical protein QFC24_006330 [Naganishia onofrii]
MEKRSCVRLTPVQSENKHVQGTPILPLNHISAESGSFGMVRGTTYDDSSSRISSNVALLYHDPPAVPAPPPTVELLNVVSSALFANPAAAPGGTFLVLFPFPVAVVPEEFAGTVRSTRVDEEEGLLFGDFLGFLLLVLISATASGGAAEGVRRCETDGESNMLRFAVVVLVVADVVV